MNYLPQYFTYSLFNSIIHIFYIFCVKFHKNKNCLYLHVHSSNLEPNHGSIPCFFLHFFTFHTTEFLFMFCVLNGYGFAICLSYTFFFRRSSILSFYSHILLAFYNVYFKTIIQQIHLKLPPPLAFPPSLSQYSPSYHLSTHSIHPSHSMLALLHSLLEHGHFFYFSTSKSNHVHCSMSF